MAKLIRRIYSLFSNDSEHAFSQIIDEPGKVPKYTHEFEQTPFDGERNYFLK